MVFKVDIHISIYAAHLYDSATKSTPKSSPSFVTRTRSSATDQSASGGRSSPLPRWISRSSCIVNQRDQLRSSASSASSATTRAAAKVAMQELYRRIQAADAAVPADVPEVLSGEAASVYRTLCNSLIHAFYAQRAGVDVGAAYHEVLAHVDSLRPYKGPWGFPGPRTCYPHRQSRNWGRSG